MKKFLKNLFSTTNEINENLFFAFLFAIGFLVATFTNLVDGEKYYIIAGMVALCLGIAPFKK